MIILASFRDWLLEPFRDNLPLTKDGYLKWECLYANLDSVEDDVKEWLNENLPKNSWSINLLFNGGAPDHLPYYKITFKMPEYAMAFKLRWL